MRGRTTPPWMMCPRMDAKMYFPRLVTSRTTSSISTILLPTRNIMPNGTYLGRVVEHGLNRLPYKHAQFTYSPQLIQAIRRLLLINRQWVIRPGIRNAVFA